MTWEKFKEKYMLIGGLVYKAAAICIWIGMIFEHGWWGLFLGLPAGIVGGLIIGYTWPLSAVGLLAVIYLLVTGG